MWTSICGFLCVCTFLCVCVCMSVCVWKSDCIWIKVFIFVYPCASALSSCSISTREAQEKNQEKKKKKHVSLRVATFLALASVLSSKPPLPVNKLPSQYWCMLGTCFTYPRGNLSYTCQPSGGPSTIACKCAWDRKTARISRAYGCRNFSRGEPDQFNQYDPALISDHDSPSSKRGRCPSALNT